jgi:hypothetical protein
MKILKFTPKDGIQARKHRKENNFQESYNLIVKTKDKENPLKEIASLRIYGTNAMNYACLWINDSDKNIHCNGSGSAGGYGYHRPSAAAAEALESAGIELSNPIGGRGDSAISEAMKALAVHFKYKTYLIFKAHG